MQTGAMITGNIILIGNELTTAGDIFMMIRFAFPFN